MKDSYGNSSVNTEGLKPTFSAVLSNFTSLAANATDFFIVSNPVGSNRLYKINYVSIRGTATTATSIDFYFIKRTTANTGGTTTTTGVTLAAHDTNDSSPTATVVAYTANPTTGTGAIIRAQHSFAGSTAAQLVTLEYTFGNRPAKCITLKPGESFALNFNGQAIPAGLALFAEIEFTEEILSFT